MLHPKLFKRDTKGNTRFWQVETDGVGSYRTWAGLTDGNPVVSGWTKCVPKNVGRSNETSPKEQCDLEVAALYERKRDSHYVEFLGQVNEKRKYFEVMLAETYNEKTRKFLFVKGAETVYVQPKFDGLRGPTTKEGSFSRKGNRFETVQFISEALAPVLADHPDLVFDGELYNHDYADDFNELVSTIKRGKPTAEDLAKAKELVQLHVYDLFIPSRPEATFKERFDFLNELLAKYEIDPKIIVPVETIPVTSFEELDAAYERFMEEMYEGAMIRFDTPYEHKRTKAILKYKEMEDKEFKILRIEEGKGNWAGYAKRIYVELEDGTENKGGMKGKQAYLRQVFLERDEYVGGEATMRFQGRTPDGKLRFPRSLAGKLYKGQRDD